jgi:transcriptional regulator with XRE-family HTH domain
MAGAHVTAYGKLLERLRERAGMTKAQVCHATGIDPGYYHRLETGDAKAATGAQSLLIERALGIADGALFAQSAIERGEVSVEHLSKRDRALVATWARNVTETDMLIAIGRRAPCDLEDGRLDLMAELGIDASEIEWAWRVLSAARVVRTQREVEEIETSEALRGVKVVPMPESDPRVGVILPEPHSGVSTVIAKNVFDAWEPLPTSILATAHDPASPRASVSAQVLEILSRPSCPRSGRTARQIADLLVPARRVRAVTNVLSGLRTRGKVTSSPGPSGRERVWRLA